MIESFFTTPFTIQRLHAGPSGPFIDGFAHELEFRRYDYQTARRYLRAAAHLGQYLEVSGGVLTEVDADVLEAFFQHLPHCNCPQSNGGTTLDVLRGAKLFLKYLRSSGRLEIAEFKKKIPPEPDLVTSFKHWLKHDKGLSESSLRNYGPGAIAVVEALGSDPGKYNPQDLRSFVLDSSKSAGPGTASTLVKGLRIFLRYLIQKGACCTGLDRAIPTLAGWRHAALPTFISAEEVQKILTACEGDSIMAMRDKAIILLLARLGLRAGDVAELRISKIDWNDGSFLVSGKSQREECLPLSQEVGNAIVTYLEKRPQVGEDKVFLINRAPFQPFASGGTVSQIVKRRTRLAGVATPRYGAHILRHTAATEMLRHGVPLYEIGQVLRHRSLDMTAYYAKVDIELLKQVAQPWPEVLSC